ncbi:uncharacterized protein LOC142902338 isoform X2 [Nelusetta ayraudi]|uniref:uncharacterized protein LOC142902338 isoform X2 n=1 Tax=Nelusetta ayraudi TaxID=303726 RepID=UPI003F72D120
MEKLQLWQATGSSAEDESVDEEELQRFRELKDKMVLLDQAEQDLIMQSSGRSRRPLAHKKKRSTKAGALPELSLLDSHHVKRSEERLQVAPRGLDKQQSCLGSTRKHRDSVPKWGTQAKIIQEKKTSQHRLWVLDKQEGAEADLKAAEEGDRGSHWTQSVTKSWAESEQRIHSDAEKRHRNPNGSSAEQMAVAERCGDEIKRMQEQLQHSAGNDENDGSATTGGSWQRFLHNASTTGGES